MELLTLSALQAPKGTLSSLASSFVSVGLVYFHRFWFVVVVILLLLGRMEFSEIIEIIH